MIMDLNVGIFSLTCFLRGVLNVKLLSLVSILTKLKENEGTEGVNKEPDIK